MNIDIANTRIKDVLNVDSINSSQSDFFSTHVPFRRISVLTDQSGSTKPEYISENEVFDKYFNNSNLYDKHQLIIVDGSSGSGKSHFIRWIKAKYNSLEENKDVVLLIRRSDNTLKGTIKQFLNIDEVKNIKNKDIYERLVQVNQNISEKKFKFEIYHKFIVEVENDDSSFLSSNDKKNFKELLSSSEFEERMLMFGGPIERIYSKIVDTATDGNEDILALFDKEDFILDYEFNERLKSNASKKAVKMANKLLPEEDGLFYDEDCNPETLAKYMNSKVETVIKSCAGIEPGDFQQIFKEIRQELYKQGKNLVLLIEDITACTGINKDLLDALIVEHTGTNAVDKMCRLVSVVGTTSEYYKEFRSNYLDRITAKITIEDGSIGNNRDDLIQFVAKYLNVISIKTEDIESWYKNGAIDSEYPIHNTPENENWEYYNYNGKRLNLYPFTKNAIINLYENLDVHKTPRYIIRKIIEPALDNIIRDREHFPKFIPASISKLNFETDARVNSILSNMKFEGEEKKNYRDRLCAILRFWGDSSLNISRKGYIGGTNLSIFKEFGFLEFAEKIVGSEINIDYNTSIKIEKETIDEESIDELNKETVIKKENKQFSDFTNILFRWYFDKKPFTRAYQVRDAIIDYIFDTIEWQREGVPLVSKQMVAGSSYKLISIKRQDRGIDKGLILLEDTEETYQLLLAFGKWLYLGNSSWNFDGAASSIRFVTCWLEKSKNKFVDIVRGCSETAYPDYIKCALIADIYRGIFNGDYSINKIGDIQINDILKSNEEKSLRDQAGHSEKWTELVQNIIYSKNSEENNNLIQKYFNLIQGNTSNSKMKIIKHTEFERILKDIKQNDCFNNVELDYEDKIKDRNLPKEYLKKITSRIEEVLASEEYLENQIYNGIYDFFGFKYGTEIEKGDIVFLLNNISDFYKTAERNKINIVLRTSEIESMKKKSNFIADSLNEIHLKKESNNLEKIIRCSKNHINILRSFYDLLCNVQIDISRVSEDMNIKKSNMEKEGNWNNNIDPRFDEKNEEFNMYIKLMEE